MRCLVVALATVYYAPKGAFQHTINRELQPYQSRFFNSDLINSFSSAVLANARAS